MQHSGHFELSITPDPALDAAALGKLWHVAEAFAAALSLEMFGRANVHAHGRGKSVVHYTIGADNVPEYAFRVLDGMLHYFHGVIGPLAAWAAFSSSQPGINLCATTEPVPAALTQYPFPTTLDLDAHSATPPLSVEVTFSALPWVEQQKPLCEEILVWHHLMQGGYPIQGNQPGESGTSPPIVRFEGSDTLRYHVDMWQTGYEAFVPLFNLLQRWDRQVARIARVDIYS